MKAFSWIGSLFEKNPQQPKTSHDCNVNKSFPSSSFPKENLAQSEVLGIKYSNNFTCCCPATLFEAELLCLDRYLWSSFVTRSFRVAVEQREPAELWLNRAAASGALGSSWRVGARSPCAARQFSKAHLQQSNWALTAVGVFSPRVSSVLSADK